MPFKLKLKKSRHYSVVSKSLFVLTVELLDGTSIECTLSSESTGQECLDVVCQKLGLNQPKFFGLQYMGRSSREVGTCLTWLELDRPIKRQLDKHARGLCVFVRVMYYVLSGVKLLNDEVTRNHYFLQLKMDVIDGRITCTPQQAIELASYCMQAEFGNFDVERHTAHYLKDFQLFPKDFTDPTFLENLTEVASRQHALLHNTPQAIAEEKYICACQKLNGYGQERYNVKERNGEEVCIKVAVNGIKITYAIKEEKIYEWTDISNVINHKREFTIQSVHGHDKADFQFGDAEMAKNAWRFCILQHMFFRQFEAANVVTAEASNMNVRLTQSMGSIEQAPASQQSSSHTSTIPSQQQNRSANKLRTVGVGSYDDIHLHTLATSNGHALAPLYPPQSANCNFQGQHMSQQQQQQAHLPLTQQQRAQSTSCLDLNNPAPAHLLQHHHHTAQHAGVNSTSTPDLDRLRSLLPSYRPAPDYETALVQQQQQQQHQQHRLRGLVGVLQQQGIQPAVHRGYLYSSQPEIHSGYVATGPAATIGQQICYPDVTHNNVERKVLYSGVPGGGLYAQSQILVADHHQRNMVDLVENIRLMHLNNNNTKPPPPPYPMNMRISSNSTPDLAGTSGNYQHYPTKPPQLFNSSVPAAATVTLASSGSSPDLVSGGTYNQQYQQQQMYVDVHGGVHRSQSYLPTSGTYENLASIFPGSTSTGNGNINNGANSGATVTNATTTAAVIVENPNITKHIRKVYDEHGNIIYCMPANMKQILEDNQIHGTTPFVVRRSAQTMVPAPIAAERHKSNTEPIYENIPFPPYEQQHQMRARTQSIQSAPPEIVIASTAEGLYANIKDVEHQLQAQQSQQIAAHQMQQHAQHISAKTIISIDGRQQGIISDNNIDSNLSVNNKGNGNHQPSISGNTTSPAHFDTQSTAGSDTMSRTNTFIVNRSANASLKSSAGSTPRTSTPDRNTPTTSNSNRSTCIQSRSNALSNSGSSVTKLNSTATSSVAPFDPNSTTAHSIGHTPISMSDISTSNTNSTNTSTSSAGKKKKHRWGALLLGRGKSGTSDSEEKVKSATLGREKERSKGGGAGGSGAATDRQHRWSTGLSKLHHPLPPSISKETMCQLLENKLLDNQLYFEFDKIPKRKANADCNTAMLTENLLLNKYPDLVPYEDNRLRLTPTKENKSGYINASHITATVGSKQRFYIAAQGPYRHTLPYFWQCVWESEVYLILQLTDLNNDTQYLPDAKERCVNIGKEYQIWWEFSQKTGHCITSKVRLCHVTSRRYRTLWHLHYTDWGEPKTNATNGNSGIPDKDCPQSVAHALGFLEELQSVQQHSMTEIPPGHNKNPPVLVHCPTAVGRTGLVILCDLLLYTVDHNQSIHSPKTFHTMLSCHCLNIIIETETNELDAVPKDIFTEVEAKDDFFKQDIQQIRNLVGINKACNSLVYHRVVGSWQVQKCINCNLDTHAIHQSKGAASVLISTKLYKLADINKLKASEQRSEIFNIIVKSQQNDEEYGNDYASVEVQQPLANLRQQMNEVLTRYNAAVEERVREYTDQQYAALEDIKERALREHKALTRLIIGNNRANAKSIGIVHEKVSSAKSDMSSTATSALPEVKTAPLSIAKNRATFSPKLKAVHAPHVSMSSENGASFDSEGLFPLEDMDDIEADANAAYEDSDNEDTFRDDGIGIEIHPRQRLGSQSILAKSLPVDIPVFMALPQNHNDDEQEDIVPHTEDPMDIAASIRALARSVHGDTVFGDLPRPTRPRFTTNI